MDPDPGGTKTCGSGGSGSLIFVPPPSSGAAEAVHLRGGDDPAVAVLGRAAQATQLQQEVERGAERILLLAPVQPLPQRGGQGGARQEVRHHCLTGQFDSPQVTCFILSCELCLCAENRL